mmetsp:Transcript_7338/g.18823  ORF Transcript_7338/g.18823 Transcript_7338/m.18823 type:complete len:566 (-) Transcript_7338:262-1959(-)|eukprot:CAMPEP_0198236070 /NCGR_PEP_ID=MMETSP1446-20131203/1979_1 /TAXON_ID=1461542 ORGANISM="Unidentified sp, Strain CCMP2111" /NCGR_SAMPLE_ID=MMETSP1446 /ASSEMBLY_ACC=CAM_ASM_001112 /LENGTH=565 /DNA_ID=CAMNT_0043917627 /DNA_START=212 /DNA_END=1909 /DNA_ORIENTATION=+
MLNGGNPSGNPGLDPASVQQQLQSVVGGGFSGGSLDAGATQGVGLPVPGMQGVGPGSYTMLGGPAGSVRSMPISMQQQQQRFSVANGGGLMGGGRSGVANAQHAGHHSSPPADVMSSLGVGAMGSLMASGGASLNGIGNLQGVIGTGGGSANNSPEMVAALMEKVVGGGAAGAGGDRGVGGAGQQHNVTKPAFDASDFPSLGLPRADQSSNSAVQQMGRSTAGSKQDAVNVPAMQFGMLRHKHSGGDQHGGGGEFSLQNEEFPALGGGNRVLSKLSSDSQEGANANMFHRYGQMMQPQHQVGAPVAAGMQQQQMQRGTKPPASGAVPSSGPSAKAGAAGGGDDSAGQQQQTGGERFGLLGLLGVIRMNDADLTTLALGTDLTTLGLNLNSPDSLYKSFASPWSDVQQEPLPSNFKVPACYLHVDHPSQPPPQGQGDPAQAQEGQQMVVPLQAAQIKNFPLETLFYMFYGMVMDEGQLLAAEQLWSRGWCYHREFKLWLARVPNTEPIVKTDRYERGSFLVFDSMAWDIVRKDNFVLHYQALEQSPRVQQQQQQQQQKTQVAAVKA